MQKVAVFGNAGGGKSMLSKRLSEITGLPLYVLDKLQYQPGGAEISHEDYLRSPKQIKQFLDQQTLEQTGGNHARNAD